ncbi:MAG: hypothetical protein ACK4NY_09820 [Spirosomataceae bacterium]
MRKLICIIFLLISRNVYCQSVTISPTNGSKLIEVKSTNKAVQMPSVSATTAIASPQKGMVVFDDATGTLSYYNGSQWVPLSNSTTGWAVNGTNLNSTNSGNVGVGESSPNAKLHVKTGSSGASVPAFTNSIFENSTHNVVSILSPDNTQSGVIMQRPTTGSGGVTYNTDESLSLVANGSTRVNIESNGNVGIGTSNPLTKVHINNGSSGQLPNTSADLTVEDDATALIQLLTPQNNESGVSFGLPSNVASGGIMYNNGGKKALQFRTRNNVTQMTIDSLGTLELRRGEIKSSNNSLFLSEGNLSTSHLSGFNMIPISAGIITVETSGDFVSIVQNSSLYNGELIPEIDSPDTSDGFFSLYFQSVVGTPNASRPKLIVYSLGYNYIQYSKVIDVVFYENVNEPRIWVKFDRALLHSSGDFTFHYLVYGL